MLTFNDHCQPSRGSAGLGWMLVVVAVLSAGPLGCNRFSPGGGGAVVAPPPPPPPPPPPVPVGDVDATRFGGIGAAYPTVDGFAFSWDAPVGPDAASQTFEYDVFVSLDGTEISFDVAFAMTRERSIVLDGLARGTPVEASIRARSLDDPDFVDRNAIRLGGVVADLYYVDASIGASGDGRSPGQAFRTVNEAVIAGIGLGAPINALVAGGLYEEQVATLGDVHLFGGFPPGFVGERDRLLHPSTLRPTGTSGAVLRVLANEGLTVIDGLELVARGVLDHGVEIREAELRFSNGSILDAAAEGLTITCDQSTRRFDLHRVLIRGCGTEGVEARGSFNAFISASVFRENGNEGVEFDDLSPQPLEQASLRVTACQFLSNGDDGLDVDFDELDPLVGGTSEDGAIQLIVEECVAEDNEQWGFLVDVDFTSDDEITARAVLRGNRAARQGRDGFRVDGDAPALFVLVGNQSAANRERGISITGEGERALTYVSNHWDLGSGLEGVQVLGIADVILSHVAVTGSRLSSVVANDTTFLRSGALWLGMPAERVAVAYSYSDAGLSGVGNVQGPPEVLVAPSEFTFLGVAGGPSDLTLPGGVDAAVGQNFEIDDDGVLRTVTEVDGRRIVFEPEREVGVPAMAVLGWFDGEDAVEDARLLDNSPWIDAGNPLERDADASITDIGVRGGTLGEFRSREEGVPFIPERISPRFGREAEAVSEVVVRFTRAVDPGGVDPSQVQVRLDGVDVPGTLDVDGRTVRWLFDAPATRGVLSVDLADVPGLADERLLLPISFETRIGTGL